MTRQALIITILSICFCNFALYAQKVAPWSDQVKSIAQNNEAILFKGVPQVDVSLRTDRFLNPSNQFRPIALWRINGEPEPENIVRQIQDLKKTGFGSLPARNIGVELRELMITTAKELDLLIMARDGRSYPSGGASGQMEKMYPQHLRKVLEKTEYNVGGFSYWKCFVPNGKLMAAVAMNMETLERLDLTPYIDRNNLLSWQIPNKKDDWRVMFFNIIPATFWKQDMPVDYLDPEALSKLRELEYDRYAKECSQFFQDPIVWTQYDDVGFLARERTWTGIFNEKFKEVNGFDPTLYYPALWYNIGPETWSARVAFFNTRSELLAEGHPKMVKEWADGHGITTVGQPPGNYKDQPVDILGDAFKFFRYTDIPQTDAIIRYGNGLHGFKLTSSASDLYDRPITMGEAYGAFPDETVDVKMLYRVPTELFVRGCNSIMVHYGSWNHPDPHNMTYKIMGYPDEIVNEFPLYNDFIGRSCYMLTGGRTVADIGLLYPIASLQAGFYFDAPEYVGHLRRGWWTYPEADYLKISGMLTNEIRRDFTFVHPEYLATEKYSVNDDVLKLETENFQEYKLMIIPGGKVIPVDALEKIKRFYEGGGKVLATTLLPSLSAERGQDSQVKKIIDELFGTDAATDPKMQTNQNGGMALFLPKPDVTLLSEYIDEMVPHADVIFSDHPKIESELGNFSFIHKIRDGKDIYYFGNSSDDEIDTAVLLKGKLSLESWNPHNGEMSQFINVSYEEKDGHLYTKYKLTLPALQSVFWIGNDNEPQ